MKKTIFYILIVLTLASCVDIEEFPNSVEGNFEALWTIMDEHYCFFDYKKETLGVDWDEVHTRYAPPTEKMSSSQLFELLTNMIGELQDGHVNLSSGWDYGRNWSWREDYPTNFSDSLCRQYMGTDYRIVSGIEYRVLDDNIGYMRVESFQADIGDGNLDYVLYYLLPCRSLIIDIRSNSGGTLTTAQKLASRFIEKKTLVGYIRHKTGTGHNDFSDYEAIYLSPADGFHWDKQVFLLTNRGVFSAANEFVMYMRCNENCTVVGDKSGGGGGLPFTNELPNGWGVRFSACPTYDTDKLCIEHGIEPDVSCQLEDEDLARGIDTIIEKARSLSD